MLGYWLWAKLIIANVFQLDRRGLEKLIRFFFTRDQIGQLNPGFQPLGVGNDPFIQQQLRQFEIQLKLAAGILALVLQNYDHGGFILPHIQYLRVARQIYVFTEQQTDWRGVEGIFVNGLQIMIFDGKIIAIGDKQCYNNRDRRTCRLTYRSTDHNSLQSLFEICMAGQEIY